MDKFIGFVIISLVLGVVGAVLTLPFYFEASSYNRLMCPAKEATIFDAVFTQLRVDGTSNCK